MKELEAGALTRSIDPELFGFESTAELSDDETILGQERAVEAFTLGVDIEAQGFNVFALGSPGLGKRGLVLRFLNQRAADRPTPDDWCYVNNFEDVQRPLCLRLPAGRGRQLRHDLEAMVGEVRSVLGGAFHSEDYQNQRSALTESFKRREREALEALHGQARERGIGLMRTPMGIAFAPIRDDELVSAEAFAKLPEEEQTEARAHIEELQGELQKIARATAQWRGERHEKLQELNREVTRFTVTPLVDRLRRRFEGLDAVQQHFDRLLDDLIETAPQMLEAEGEEGESEAGPGETAFEPLTQRYAVNVIVDNADSKGAPVVVEDIPTYGHLIGRVESQAEMGTLVTDFTMIKAGALHRANGGYLLLDAKQLLQRPMAWEGLRRALLSRELRIDSPGEAMGMALINTASLDPQCIPLDVKVVLVGDRSLYYAFARFDEDFRNLFKIPADFEDTFVWDDDAAGPYAEFVARQARLCETRPLDRGAVAQLMQLSARYTGDQQRLTLHARVVRDLLVEANYWSGKAQRDRIGAEDIRKASDHRIRRQDRARGLIHEQILRETVHIETSGETVAQVNGLSVMQIGGFAFGKPSRITARARIGRGQVVDIEREVDLSGPLHSKGVLILSGYLGQRYADERPLALAASLVFEQSYGGVDGDSASLAELCALLSAIARVPIRQSLSVTGSMDQHGRAQAIGGVNEKIEGFFDICNARGLTGDQGAIIPQANAKHLMLRDDVIEAVKAGQFHVWTVQHADEVLALLTGREAGTEGEDGNFPKGSVNRLVRDRLEQLALKARRFGKKPAPAKSSTPKDEINEPQGGDSA